MRQKKYPPIIISVILLILGVISITIIYNQWNNEKISVSSPIINKVETDAGQKLNLKSIIYEAEKNVKIGRAHV